MKEIMDNGTTTILVSHSLEQIRRICNKVLWLEKGTIRDFGDTKSLCDEYSRFIYK